MWGNHTLGMGLGSATVVAGVALLLLHFWRRQSTAGTSRTSVALVVASLVAAGCASTTPGSDLTQEACAKAKSQRGVVDGKPLAGSFKIGSNEIVYIGHFAPECPQRGNPTIWRYYLKDTAAFREYLAKVKDKYPFLDVSDAQFRLFETTTIGAEYRLP